MGVQFRAVSCQKVSEPLRTDEARILWVVLRINQDRTICNPSVTEDMAVQTHTRLLEMTEHFRRTMKGRGYSSMFKKQTFMSSLYTLQHNVLLSMLKKTSAVPKSLLSSKSKQFQFYFMTLSKTVADRLLFYCVLLSHSQEDATKFHKTNDINRNER